MGNIKEEAKRIEDKINREGKRLEKKTSISKKIWIGLAILVAGAFLIKVFGS